MFEMSNHTFIILSSGLAVVIIFGGWLIYFSINALRELRETTQIRGGGLASRIESYAQQTLKKIEENRAKSRQIIWENHNKVIRERG